MVKQPTNNVELSGGQKRGEQSSSSSSSSSPLPPPDSLGSVILAGNYAPSPNTCDQALTRAGQLRVQTLLRQLLAVEDNQRLGVMRILSKVLRELDYQLCWLAQTDLLESVERILQQETERDTDWRLLNDCTQLLLDALPRAAIEPDWESLGPILARVIENLGHQRSELRRSSLLLINLCLHHYRSRPVEYQRLIRLFIDRGLNNSHNEQAQRGAILSLPLLLAKQTVEGHDLQPLVSCLADLLVSSHSRLFYSLYLALQRLHQTLGDRQFALYLDQCNPEARILYKQAASRTNSISSTTNELRRLDDGEHCGSIAASRQVTFDESAKRNNSIDSATRRLSRTELEPQNQDQNQNNNNDNSDSSSQVEGQSDGKLMTDVNESQQDQQQQQQQVEDAASPLMSESSNDLDSVKQSFAWQASGNDKHKANKSSISANYMSDVSSTCSSDAHLVNPAHYMNEPALNGHPLDGLLLLPPHHLDHDDNLAISQLGVCCSPTVEVGPSSKSEFRFGIFPRHLIQVGSSQANTSRQQQDRLGALNEMMCIIRESPINHLAILITYLDPFIDQFLSRLIEPSTDYRSGLVALDMIETIVIKTKLSTLQFVRPLTQILVRALADTRSLYRDNTIRVIHKMMAYLPPQHVIDALFEHKHHRNPIVREQLVDRVTAAVLNYDRQEFNLTKLCYHVLPMLADHHANVRLAALECIATLANALGPERICTLLTAAEAVQTGCDYDGLLDAIYARLKRRALPRCNTDGSIRHLIRPFLSSTHAQFHQEHRAADVRWVMEAPSSHQHLHEHEHEHSEQSASAGEHHVHAHRPGVYSPTVAEEMSRSRKQLLAHELEKHHAHHHAIHQHHDKGAGRGCCRADESDSLKQPTQIEADQSEHAKGQVERAQRSGDAQAQRRDSVNQQQVRRDSGADIRAGEQRRNTISEVS